MNPSLGLVFSLFLLAPGIGFFSGLFFGPIDRLQATPPLPSSLLGVAVIGLSALAFHAAAALLFWFIRDVFYVHETPSAWLDFYRVITELPGNGGQRADRVARFLAVLVGLSIAAFLAGGLVRGVPSVRGLLYGWLAGIIERSRPKGRFVAAYVLSTIEHEGVRVGYQGLIEHVMLDSDREISSLVLRAVDRFTFKLRGDLVINTRPATRTRLDRLYLEKTQIANVVFQVIDAGAPPSAPPTRQAGATMP